MNKKDFFKNMPYGAYITHSGERILFNRHYQPIAAMQRRVEDIKYKEFFYDDATPWGQKVYNSENEIVVNRV